MTIREPTVTEGVDFINFSWGEVGIRATAERYTPEGYTELSLYDSNNPDAPPLITPAKVNLRSMRTVNELVRTLERVYPNLPWGVMLTQLAEEVIVIARRGESVIEIWPDDDTGLAPSYLLEPLLYQNHPTIIFGDYSSGKSLFALVVAYVCQLPYYDNALGLKTAADPAPCLYLDYEDEQDSFRRRWSALERGLGKGSMPIMYRRMSMALADDVERLRRIIYEKGVKLLIVDSLGPAAKGNLNDSDPANQYHRALRSLGVTSLTVAHCAKDQITKRRTIFGSIFFTNLARSVWEVKAEQELGEDELLISLKQTKVNLSGLHPTLGYRFMFIDNSIKVARADLRDTALSGELPLPWQIKSLLRQGSYLEKEISEQLDARADTVGRTLRRMRTKNQVTKLEDGTWGLCL